MARQDRKPLLILLPLPLIALVLAACDPGRITGAGQLECDADLLTGIFSYDNNEDLQRCLQGKRPLAGD